MPERLAYAAIDLGASTGRVVAGRIDGDRVTLEELRRFRNDPVRLPDGLHWNLLQLLKEALAGLRSAGQLSGIGVDAWGVDYALLDERDRVLGLPYHYRDERTHDMVARAHARVAQPVQYAVTGTQTLPINTVFQLLADEGTAALRAARRIALIPDLVGLWLSGVAVNELTAASTTGLLDARSGHWALALIEQLGLPTAPFGELVAPGTCIGRLRGDLDLPSAPVYAVAGHDTASAFAAAPVIDEHAAILSSGTWSLLGMELSCPVLTDTAREANLTNERGVDGTTRLLKNVMGLWLEQECARLWGESFEQLHRLASAARGEVPLFDPDDERFLGPGDVPARMAACFRESGQPVAADRGMVIRSIHTSLACKYRWVLEHLELATGREIRSIVVIGGGARNAGLCALTADITRRQVIAGPVEATALGNILVQARAAGQVASLQEIRELVARSIALETREPQPQADGPDATYQRFLAVTGLGTAGGRASTQPEEATRR